MKQKQLTLWMIACILSLSTALSAKEKIYSEWSIQNRQTGEYLGYENGKFCFGATPENDRYLWMIESTPAEEFLIRNKQNGQYLQLAGNNVVCGKKTAGENLKWNYGSFDFVTQKNCGWYTLENKSAVKGTHLVGNNNALTMEASDRNNDFSTHWNIVREKGSPLSFSFTPDKVTDASFLGTREARALSATEIVSDYHGTNRWKLQKDISAFPRFTAPNNPMLVALYNMALEEMLLNIRTDSTFMTGALWPDTWTRDAVYSIYFSFSWIMPEMSRRTLEKQTLQNPKEALQDTGSGGSWPISTDRVVWAMAAWEYYLSTGDKNWLESVYDGLKNTAIKDIHVAFDPKVGLFRGETCSMDWRTHTYPNWFRNAVIAESYSCGTNVLHYFLYEFLRKAGRLTGKPAGETALWDHYRSLLKQNINEKFWDEKLGLYTCYLYPEYMGYQPTSRVGVMSNGLAAILGVASDVQTRKMVDAFPLYPYGAAVFYPSIPDDFAYHNKSVWPVWQTPYLYAARNAGNTAAVDHLMKSLVRGGALFLTHKENMNYDTGYDRGTALNSSRQLWSVSSYISMVYRILFGMTLTENGLTFSPVLPELVNGKLSLEGFRYRDAVLDITVWGKGDRIQSLWVNGKKQSLPYLFGNDLKGKFRIQIEMTQGEDASRINLVQPGPRKEWSPVESVLVKNGNTIDCRIEPELRYFLCGTSVRDKEIKMPHDLSGEPAGFYSVYSMDKQGFKSDLSNPVVKTDWEKTYEAEDAANSGELSTVHPGFSGRGFVIDLGAKPAGLTFTVEVPQDGTYALALKGANGHGPDGTYCAIRSVFIDGEDAGTFILEATGNWNLWLNSDYIVKELKAGRHLVTLTFNPEEKGYDYNMSHGKENANDCNIDCLRLIKL